MEQKCKEVMTENWSHILVQARIYHRLRIDRDGRILRYIVTCTGIRALVFFKYDSDMSLVNIKIHCQIASMLYIAIVFILVLS